MANTFKRSGRGLFSFGEKGRTRQRRRRATVRRRSVVRQRRSKRR